MRFGSLNVSTFQDTGAWIALNPDAMKWGYLVNVYTICLLVEKVANGERDYYKKMQTVQKLELGSPREAEALVALSAPVPNLFTDSGKGMFGKKEFAFSQFPTFASFKAQTDRITRAITTVGSGMNNQIDMNVPSGSHIHRLLKLAVSLSCAFLKKYITWLTKSTEESLGAGLGAGPSWCLSTRLGESVFRTLNEVRTGVSNSFNTKNPKELAAIIWLTGGRTHDAMEKFMEKDFQDHSAINGEYIKFMVHNNN